MKDDELSELEYIQVLMESLELTPENTIAELLDAVRKDEIGAFIEEMEHRHGPSIE